MADDRPDPSDDLPGEGVPDALAADDTGEEEQGRVARSRYVRSGWGVLCGVGIVAGIVIVVGGFADFDTDPFCARAAEEAELAVAVAAADPAAQPELDPLEEAKRRLALFEEYRGLVPYDLEDTVDIVIAHEERLVAELESLGPDADAAARAEVESRVAAEDLDQVPAARFDIDIYAADVCEGQLPQLVD